MRDHSHHIELSRDEAVRQTLEACEQNDCFAAARVPERIAIAEACGRVLAADVVCDIDAPNCLTCGMDSVAVHWSDFEACAPGVPDTSQWVRGKDWQFANTGIAMPEGFDTAVVIEHVTVSDDEEHIVIDSAPSKQFAGTRPAGSQLKKGDILARKGDVVTPEIAARIASGNQTSVLVLPRPRVAFIPTGNELTCPGDAIVGRGRNLETNSVVVRAKVEKWGGVFVPFDVVPDVPERIERAVREACAVADIVVLNAGSSKGSDDWSVEQLERIGRIICHQTNHGPGHHSSFAIVDNTPIVGISGPSAGAQFTLDFYLYSVMRAFSGLDASPRAVPVRLAAEFPAGGPGSMRVKPGEVLPGEVRPPEATEPGSVFFSIRPVNVRVDETGQLLAEPVQAPPVSPLAAASNALYLMPSGPGAERPKAGDVIVVEMRP